MDPTHGVFLWEDIISYSLTKTETPEINIPGPWRSKKYLLTFYFLKSSKLSGNEIREFSWKIKDLLVNQIGAFLKEKIPQKETASIDDEIYNPPKPNE